MILLYNRQNFKTELYSICHSLCDDDHRRRRSFRVRSPRSFWLVPNLSLAAATAEWSASAAVGRTASEPTGSPSAKVHLHSPCTPRLRPFAPNLPFYSIASTSKWNGFTLIKSCRIPQRLRTSLLMRLFFIYKNSMSHSNGKYAEIEGEYTN